MVATIDTLKRIIGGRPVVIMLHGKSIEGLENIITDLKKYNICYASLNFFNIMEKHILNKIGRNLDIVFDTSTVHDQLNFDSRNRIPRLTEFLSRADDNLWLTSKGLMQQLFIKFGFEEFIYNVYKKILRVEDIGVFFDLLEIQISFMGLYYSCVIGGASKIAICGFDGFNGDNKNVLDSYYKQDEYNQIRIASKGNEGGNVRFDSSIFKEKEQQYLPLFKEKTGIDIPETVNFSPNSMFGLFEKRDYNQFENWIKE